MQIWNKHILKNTVQECQFVVGFSMYTGVWQIPWRQKKKRLWHQATDLNKNYKNIRKYCCLLQHLINFDLTAYYTKG